MFRPVSRSHARRGAVLIVVLAMLVLFAVLGLSFVLYSEAQLSAARSQKLSVNQETEPNPQAAAEGWMGPFIYDVGDTGDDLTNPIRGHSLARSKYGYQAGVAGVLPFNANPLPQETITFAGGPIDSRQIVRFTYDPAFGVFDPERVYGGAAVRTNPTAALPGTYAGKNYAFTYPDRHDSYLAWQDPTTGRITLPSFHRPELGSWDPNSGASYFDNQGAAGKFKTLRPRRVEHPNFPPVPMNADGTYTGDVQNMKFTAGVQHNDSYWMDAGGPVLRWRGKNYKAMVAPLVLDLSGRVNISVAGNRKYGQGYPGGVGDNNGTTGGSEGLGPWEIDPQQLGLPAADVQALVARRQGNSVHPPRDPYTAANSTLRVNGGRLPPAYAPQDVDGNGGTNDAFTLSPAGGFSMFPTFGGRYATTAAAVATESANHPAQFNPLVYLRGTTGPGGFGHDDLLRMLARYSDPKGRTTATTSVPAGLASLTPMADTAAARQARALVTTFSVSQRWSSVLVNTTAGGQVRLGPVDLNRPLPDYRKNPNLPLSPLNIWPVGSTEYTKAREARHALARDIFVRLSANEGFLSGTSAAYDAATGNATILDVADVTLTRVRMRHLAQQAANAVDTIDGDDLTTAFVFDPLPASNAAYANDPSLDPVNLTAAEMDRRMVFGTELPRLVLNEVYSGVFNDRMEEANVPPGNRSTRPLKRRWWIELHNPTPPESAGSPARSDGGAARLRYVPNVTQLPDPVTGVVGNYAGPDFNPYRLEVAEDVTGGVSIPFGSALSLFHSAASVNPSLATMHVVKSRVDSFTHDATAPSAAATLTGDDLYKVLPVSAATGANGQNQGYYVIGPRDPFTAGGVANTLSLPDAPAGIPTPAAPVNALAYEVTPAGRGPTEDEIRGEVEELTDTSVWEVSSTVFLRRLMDPYRPAQENSALPGYNPYVVVDYQGLIPTRDRALYNSAGGGRAPRSNDGSIGRKHPYVAFPPNDIIPLIPPRPPMIVPQMNAGANPPHTFFALNNPADNIRGTAPNTHGFEWYVHHDRQLVSLPEVDRVIPSNPSGLTNDYYYSLYGYGLSYNDPMLLSTSWLNYNIGIVEVGSRLPGVPLGGREPARLNLNTVNSPAVVNALFGNTSGNHFPLTNPGQSAAVWNQLSPAVPPGSPGVARTPQRVPRATVHEGGGDLPFVWGGATSAGLVAFTNPSAPHMQQQVEPLRKAWNDITPVSDGFLVLMTVAFFEVENAGPWGVTNPPVFGRELFDKVPGDLRAEFGGVIDRSQLSTHIGAVDPATGFALGMFNPVAADAANNPVPRGVQSKLVADARVGGPIVIEAVPPGGTRPDGSVVPAGMCSILGDGVVYTLQANTVFRVGYGDAAGNTGDGEWVRVVSIAQRQLPDANGVMQNVPGQVTINVGGSTRAHGGSSPVGNVLFGHPGPQPGVTLDALRRRGLVPYFTRLEP